jgi:hypothetical protein
MIGEISKYDANTAALPSRQRWEAPTIVLERALQVAAQDGQPGTQTDPNCFLEPLSQSGGKIFGCCPR